MVNYYHLPSEIENTPGFRAASNPQRPNTILLIMLLDLLIVDEAAIDISHALVCSHPGL